MIELLPTFLAASAVVVSTAGASAGAVAKAITLRLFLFKGNMIPLKLLAWLAVAEALIMFLSMALALTMLEPYATPQLGSKATFVIALFSASAVFHIAVAWLPNLHLVGKRPPSSGRPHKAFSDLVWAGVLASMTPCAVALMAMGLWLCISG